MKKSITISDKGGSSAVNLALDTISLKKQALVFVNTRRSAEKTAEDIAKKLKKEDSFKGLADDVLNVLSRPTKQCERLSYCLQRGIAFHHAGLLAKQRELIEDNFRSGAIKIICSTPTLALGVDLPASRAIIKDLKRYGIRGYNWIPVLEYLQMCGRSGRPKYDDYGEAIAIASSENEREEIREIYVNGKPENIYSKLAVEPALRMYILSLIATRFTQNKKQLMDFFEKTFWAHQYKDMDRIEAIIDKILAMLEDWEFIKMKGDDFVSASDMGKDKLTPTIIGKRVSELYVDPLTAHFIIECLRRGGSKKINSFSFLQMISHTLEMRPLLRVKTKEYNQIQGIIAKQEEVILEGEPSYYEEEYSDFANSIKTALMFDEWASEKDEEELLERFDIRPGELRAKLDIADWLIYTSEELCKLLQFKELLKEIIKVRLRLRYGVKEELLTLVRLEGIGRVRARKLFSNKIKTIGDVKSADIMLLVQLIGRETAIKVKKQVDQDFEGMAVAGGKRRGQISLEDY